MSNADRARTLTTINVLHTHTHALLWSHVAPARQLCFDKPALHPLCYPQSPGLGVCIGSVLIAPLPLISTYAIVQLH